MIASIYSLDQFEQFNSMPGSMIIDVRSKKDYEVNHIDGAQHLDALKNNVEAYFHTLNRETPLLVYCNNGSRSNGVLRLLDLMGFKQLYTIDNSFFIWLTENTYSA